METVIIGGRAGRKKAIGIRHYRMSKWATEGEKRESNPLIWTAPIGLRLAARYISGTSRLQTVPD